MSQKFAMEPFVQKVGVEADPTTEALWKDRNVNGMGVGKCQRPATLMVGFVHSDRFRLSCKEHAENWGRHGRGYWVSKLEGFVGNWDNVIEDILHDNQCIGAAKEAGALRVAECYREQLAYVKKMAGAA